VVRVSGDLSSGIEEHGSRIELINEWVEWDLASSIETQSELARRWDEIIAESGEWFCD
jgi:hypothetical protein